MAGVAAGDPHIERLDGLRFDFHGEAGKDYLMFDNGVFRVLARLALCANETTYLSQVTVKTTEHTVQVSHDEVLIDGQVPTEQQYEPGGWVWVEKGRGVALGIEGWLVACGLDDGTHDVHRGGALEGVPHLMLNVHPAIDESWGGVMATGHGGCCPEDYEV